MAIAKVQYKENASATPQVWMDTTQKTVTAGSMLSGTTALKNDGTGITGNIASKSSSDLTASGATVTAPAGYYSSSASKSVAAGSATTPATSITANPTISVSDGGLITASVSTTKSITPTVSAGYVSSGTAGTATVSGSNTSQLTVQAAQTIHPSTTDQTIASGKYLTGTQTIKAVAITNLTAANIKKDVVVKVGDSMDDDCVTSVTGTYEGSGGGGGEATIQSITITENGIYRPPTGVDGYGPVTVNVRNTASVWQDEEGKIHLSNSGLQKNVNFVDYDGTILYSYTTDEFSELSALPSNPSHTGLTAQGWNWTKSQIASQLQAYPNEPVWVGQMYITQSGKTEIDITLDDPNYLSPVLTLGVNGTVKVNWGDGSSEDTVTGTSSSSFVFNRHVYSSVGNYTITVELVSGNYRFYNNSDSKSGVLSAVTTDNNRRRNSTYSNTISAIRIGNGISELSFANCGSLIYLTIPSGVTSIVSSAFYYCCSLTSLTIPSGVTSIGSNAFYSCSSLTSLTIPSGVTSIGNSAFSNCSSLTSLTIPSGVTSIGSSVFSTCYSLTSLIIPSGATSIGTNAFSNCRSLTSLTIPSGVTSIGTSAFYYCYSLTFLTIPSGVTSIGNSVFSTCYSLTSLIIPSGVTSIGSNTFYSCRSLTSLTIPSGVTSIGNSAFYYCCAIEEYHFLRETPPTLGTSAFDGIVEGTKIYVPAASVDDYKTATNWSTYASYIEGE